MTTNFSTRPANRANNNQQRQQSDVWLNLRLKTSRVDDKGEPVFVTIQKGLGLSSSSKLGRSFIEALEQDPERVFELEGTVHVVTEESESETYAL